MSRHRQPGHDDASGQADRDGHGQRIPARDADCHSGTCDPQYQLLSKGALKEVRLSLDNKSNGYAETTTKADMVDDVGTLYHYKRPILNKTYVTATFSKGSGFSAELVTPTIRQYANAAQAKASMNQLVTVLRTC